MNPYLEAIILGIIEGVTEFLPVSSTGHLLIAQRWLTPRPDVFNVAIQGGAVLAVLVVFREKVMEMVKNWREPETSSYIKQLFTAFFITCLVGLALKLADFSISDRDIRMVAWATLIGGFAIFGIEYWTHKKGTLLMKMTWIAVFAVTLGQIIAMVFPGTSRSGATIFAAMLAGIDRKQATEFSFLLGVPTLLAATAFELLSAVRKNELRQEMLGEMGVAFVTATLVAFLVVKWLLHFVQNHSFTIFGWYRILLGGVLLWLLKTQSAV
ncbi:MAG: undecaprenyl-diphosphate phosphatase [Verrucomicrobiota bacterium]|nr:undecaprenyl-diphosphate phosphatase [Verrucomicrobiota bacterium]